WETEWRYGMPGRNRFTARSGRSLLEKVEKSAAGPCVFISHQFADSATAAQVADELKSLEIDVWLDTEDTASKTAVANGDPEELAEAVEWGLTNCTHLLAVISPRTKGSWWVPFEVGSARGRQRPLAFFIRMDVTELPAWLTLGKKLL